MSLKKRGGKSIAIALVGISITTPTLNTVSAMELDTVTNNSNLEISMNDLSLTDLTQYYSDRNINFTEKQNSNGDVEIIFSDAEIYNEAKKEGYSIDTPMERANGVNKIVWRKDGGFNLYISKNTLLLVSGAGIGAITFLLAPFAPATVAIISSAISMVIGGNISDGRVFRFDKVKVGKYNYKYVYIKSWKQ